MTASVANYDAHSRSEQNWILGRFIVPAARLDEFEKAFAGLPTPTPGFPSWRLSVLLSSDPVSEQNWILGRFIVPAARLDEFEKAFAGLPTPTPGFPSWRLSVLLSSDPVADVTHIHE